MVKKFLMAIVLLYICGCAKRPYTDYEFIEKKYPGSEVKVGGCLFTGDWFVKTTNEAIIQVFMDGKGNIICENIIFNGKE